MVEYKIILSRDKRDVVLKNLIDNKEIFSNRFFVKDNGKDRITVKVGVSEDITAEKLFEILTR
jgi:hypothetical protein